MLDCYDEYGISVVNLRLAETRELMPLDSTKRKAFKEVMDALASEKNRATYLVYMMRPLALAHIKSSMSQTHIAALYERVRDLE